MGASDLCLGPKQTEPKDSTTDFVMNLTNITASHLPDGYGLLQTECKRSQN